MDAVGASLLGWVRDSLALATGAGRSEPHKRQYAPLASSLFHVLAYTGYIWLVGRAGAVFASQVAYVVTPSGVLLGVLFLGESHSGWVWTALLLMLGGLVLVRPRPSGERAR